MDIITYTEHLVDHESAMCTRSIVADLPDSVTNLDSLLALKCLFIIIGQRLFSSSSQFCLISTTQSRNVLYLEEVQKQRISVNKNTNPTQKMSAATVKMHIALDHGQLKRTYCCWVAISTCTSGGARAGDSTKCRFASLHVPDSSVVRIYWHIK